MHYNLRQCFAGKGESTSDRLSEELSNQPNDPDARVALGNALVKDQSMRRVHYEKRHWRFGPVFRARWSQPCAP
jgi:hypothetical protein